ncbi:hypothetical protein, variant [Capsaspora owczarzaki ATCC 30864]|nr:hypothetical protein, variant [Capsaspora owczarzaki ATCC 30864]
MRATVLVSDLLIFFPAVFLFCRQILADFTRSKQIAIAFMILLQPGLILIDHGHFQYNCISLGLALLAIVAVMRDWDILGSVLFCLSLNYKQMSLYYAPAFFSFLLGKSLQSAHPVLRIAALGVTVIATFALCWLPFLTSIDSVAQVLHRIFPIGRGLFEDKVANVWCAVSVLIKLRAIFEQALLVRISAICTLLAILPSSVNLALRPSQTGFLYALVNSSLGFFLFSYQVHEKSILLVALPASLLLASDPLNAVFFLLLSTASMFPLLHKDGLAIPYAICIVFFVIVVLHMLNVSLQACQHLTTIGKLQLAAVIVCFSGLHLAWYFYIPPAHLPHANLLLFAVVSCASFVLFAVYFNWRQWQLNGVPTSTHKLKHS